MQSWRRAETLLAQDLHSYKFALKVLTKDGLGRKEKDHPISVCLAAATLFSLVAFE